VRRILLLAALLVPCAARAAEPVSADEALGELESSVSLMESLLRGPSVCVSSMTEGRVRESLSGDAGLSPSARGVLLTAVRPSLERLYNARAFASGGPGVCDQLAPLQSTVRREEIAGDLPFDLLCKTNYYEALMAKATMLGETTMFDLCLLRNRVGDRDFKLDSLDVSCRIIAERKGSVDEVCGRLGPYYDNASIAQSCPRMLRYVSGDASVCPLFTDELVRERCEGYVAFGKAAAGDEAACAKSPHCQLMRGRPGRAAAAAEKEVVAAACGVYARPEIRAEWARAAREAARTLGQALAEGGGAAADRASAAALDARLERAARLEARAGLLAGLK
jgi:hypothetical protein